MLIVGFELWNFVKRKKESRKALAAAGYVDREREREIVEPFKRRRMKWDHVNFAT